MNARPHSVAAACASTVLPHPGGPYSSTALGMRMGDSWNNLRNMTGRRKTSVIVCFAKCNPPMSHHRILDEEEEEEEEEEEGEHVFAEDSTSSGVQYK